MFICVYKFDDVIVIVHCYPCNIGIEHIYPGIVWEKD